MKMNYLLYLLMIAALISSFIGCDLTGGHEKITEPMIPDSPGEPTRGYVWEKFCPSTSFSGFRASGSFGCNSNSAHVSASAGGGTLTFIMTGGRKYNFWIFLLKVLAENYNFYYH